MSNSQNEPLISFQGVSRSYYDNKKRVVGIQDLSFQVFSGKIISILGPSGCGKTTILKLISSILLPSVGNIYYRRDKDISYARKKSLIGLVPQSPTLLPNRTVEKNISLPLEINRISNKNILREMIDLVGLNGFENFYPYQLSGGMKQKVSIARALVCRPEVLLMDEPFSSLDEIIRERLNLELLNIQRKLNQTIIFVTHNIEEAVFISDQIIVMSAAPGRKIGEFEIDLPRDRKNGLRESASFFSEVNRARSLLQKSYG